MVENNKKEKVWVQNLYKIFGLEPERAFDYINQGIGKNEIFDKTGLTIGVQDANFSVYEGEVFVVMGLSGSGKSTLVRMINRIIEPTSGHVYLEGKDIAGKTKDELIKLRRKEMSMVFQSFALMPHLTVLENVAFGLDISGFSKKEKNDRAMKALSQVGLKANATSYPSELSGGMQQRVGLARGLAGNQSIMLMDEAFSALDPLIRTEMQDELLQLQKVSPRTIIFISHDLDEAMRIGDRIAIMEGGRIVQVGSPEKILKNPADEYVKAFFRGVNPTNVLSAGDIVSDEQYSLIRDGDFQNVLEQLKSQDAEYVYVLDELKKFLGVIPFKDLSNFSETDLSASNLEKFFLPEVKPTRMDTSLQEVLSLITQYPCPIPIVNENNIYQGTISKERFLETLRRGT